jgi:PAS domain S-box-containing protein
LATGARYAMGLIAADILPFATYFPAVLFAALVGGTGAGLVALVLSAIVGWYLFIPPRFELLPLDAVINLVLFTLAMGAIVWGVALYRRAAQRLEDSLRQHGALMDTAVDAIITVDADGIIEAANPATERLFGYEPAKLLGHNVDLLMPQPYRAEHDSYIRNYLRTGVRKVIGIGREVIGRRVDGSTFPMHLSVSEFSVNGRRRFTGFCRDLTAQRSAEERTLQFGRLVEDSLDEIYVCDASTLRFISANRGARSNLGYSAEELAGLTPLDIKTALSKREYEALIAPLKTGAKERVTLTTVHQRKDGSQYPVEVYLQMSHAEEPPVLIAHVRDLTEQKKRDDKIDMLVRELAHRSKNLLTVVHALAYQIMRTSNSFADFETRFVARLQALSQSQDLLVQGNWLGAYVADVVRSQLAHLEERMGAQIEIDGPRLFLNREATQYIGMALHELSTNAVKYGALSVPSGQVRIFWSYEPGEKHPFRIRWHESGGPRVTPPERGGFGKIVIDENVSRALDGVTALEFKPEGVRWELRIPASYVAEGALTRSAPTPAV